MLCLDHGVVVILDIGHKRETQPAAAARARAVCSKYMWHGHKNTGTHIRDRCWLSPQHVRATAHGFVHVVSLSVVIFGHFGEFLFMTGSRLWITLTLLYLLAFVWLFESCPNLPVCTGQPFSFAPFSVQEAHKPLKHSIISSGPDSITLDMNEIPSLSGR